MWRFYRSNATPFVREFGLMPGLINELGLEGAAKDVFMARLSAIHNAFASAGYEKHSPSPDTLLAADPT